MHRIFHIFLVITLLFSTAGLAVTKHFCGKVLADVSIGTEAHSCCDQSEIPSGCECSSETEHHVVDDDFQLDQQLIQLGPVLQSSLLEFIHYYLFNPLAEESSNNLSPNLDYPPFADPDIHISVQSFLL